MTEAKIILTPFQNAVRSLEDILTEPFSVIVRDATIQRFEYTFELAIKMMMRVLEAMPSAPDLDRMPFRDMIRLAAEAGLVTDPETWFGYRDARNMTSHAYDEKKAELVFEAAKRFTKNARLLCDALEKRV